MKYFSYSSQKIGFDISCELYPVSEKNKKNITNLTLAELAQRAVMVNFLFSGINTILSFLKRGQL